MQAISQRQVLDVMGRVEALRKPLFGGFTYDFGWNDALTAARQAIIAALTDDEPLTLENAPGLTAAELWAYGSGPGTLAGDDDL